MILGRAFLLAVLAAGARAESLTIVDAVTGRPIPHAIVTRGAATSRSDERGAVQLSGAPADQIGVRAAGYLRRQVALGSIAGTREIRLTPFTPKALYLSFYGIGARALREPAVRLLEQTELNALVIDVKGDRGWITYPSAVALAREVGAQKIIPTKNADEIIRSLKSMGVYLIARIVVFKDNPLALARPALAVKNAAGGIFRDREHLAWTDPFQKAVWDYNLDIAVEAARKGFDEIQFDYVRFPDAAGLVFSRPNTRENRLQAISGFFQEARKRLALYNVFLAADIFGYVCWNTGDTAIGQQIENIVHDVDYVSPMLYPSGYQFGIPGYRMAVAHPYEIVRQSLDKAAARTQVDPKHFRPWLQAFRDYAFDRRYYAGPEIRAQVRAAEEFGSDGWMLWNPHNRYSSAGLLPKKTGAVPTAAALSRSPLGPSVAHLSPGLIVHTSGIRTRAPASNLALAWLASLGVSPGTDAGSIPPPVAQIVQQMLEMNRAHSAALRSYTCLRRYIAANPRFGLRAEVVVREQYEYPAKRKLTIVSEKGSPFIRDSVIRKVIQTELASRGSNYQNDSGITPQNYTFQWKGSEVLDGQPCFVLEVTPRASRRLLMRGQIWVDSADFAIALMEGSPAQPPSLWTSQVHFVRTYQKLGQFWLPASMVSQSDVFLAGRSSLRIIYYDYQVQAATPAPEEQPQTGVN